MTWEVAVHSRMAAGYLDDTLIIFRKERDQYSYVVGPLVLKTIDSGVIPDSELMTFPSIPNGNEINDFLRAFVDAAWERGIKPTAFTDASRELSATKGHLEDFRRLVFGEKYPGKEKP